MSRTPLLAWLGLTVLLTAGCSTVPLLSLHKYHKADDRHPVSEIMCVWEPAEGRGLDNQPCRGFGGQILFFAQGYQEPVIATGDVRVYVFDEQGVNGDASKPQHQFDFPAAAWNSFLAPSNLGATYQIFIPYTRKGQHGASCTLRVRFTPEGGLSTYSKMATVQLGDPGPDLDSTSKADQDRHIITAAGETKDGAGQGIVTSDWSQLIHDPQAVANSVKHPTPGISLGQVPAGQTGNQALEGLRQAAVAASQPLDDTTTSTPAETPRSEHPRQLRSAHAPLGRPIESTLQTGAATAETSDSAGAAPRNRRHPLAEMESD